MPEVEGDLDGAAALVAAEGECLEDVADPPRARHRPRPHPIHLLAGRTLQERVAGVAQQRLQTRPVVGVAALGQTEGSVVLLAQTDGALRGRPVPGDCVGGDQVTEDVISEGEAILFVTIILHI